MKQKKLKIALVASLAVVLLLAATLTVFAYFTTQVYVYTDDGREVAHVGMNLQLLFGKLNGVTTTDLGIPSYCVVSSATGEPVVDDNGVWFSTVADATEKVPPAEGVTYYLQYRDGTTLTTTYNSKAPWGSAQNPYIISEARHLQNLSALQSVGYFDLLYIANNFDANGYIAGSAAIPYFLICVDSTKTDDSGNVIAQAGNPIAISGTDLAAIKPIGSAEHPFIGVIGGAFVDGTTTVAGNQSTVSAIDSFQIQTNTNQTDVGLFGYIGYLGTEPADATAGTKFDGVTSAVQDILLSDVQVVVKNPTVAEVVSELLGLQHVFNNHRFSYTGVKDTNGNQITATVPPHENHHIGIFAGHVSYAKAEYISVYYSSADKCAIDLLHTNVENQNYHSSTGIVGFMHNMNSTVSNQGTATAPTGHCQVSYGGITSSGVSVTPDTPGAGGGDEIGIGRGYVVAKSLYEGYHYISGNQGLYDRIWKYTATVDGETQVYYGPMFYEQADGTYVTQNGEAVTFADGIATYTDAGGTAKSFKIYSKRTAASATAYTYTLYNGTQAIVSFTPDATTNVELPMSIWEYVLKKVDASGKVSEHESDWTFVNAVLLEEKTTDTYVLKETRYTKNAAGILTPVVNEYSVSLSENGSTATITGATYSDGLTPVTISNVILLRLDGKYYVRDAEGNWVVPEFFREKALKLVDATTSLGTSLCIQSESSSGKYFYDGVFTFALSTVNDTIESTWENETPDQMVIGPDDPEEWEKNISKGNKTVVAYIKPITTPEIWQDVLSNGKDIFIGYHGTFPSNVVDGVDIGWAEQSLNVMSLATSTTSDSLIGGASNFSLGSIEKQFVSVEDRQSLIDAMSNNEEGAFPSENSSDENELLLQGIINGSIQILKLDSQDDLEELKSKYRIVPGNASDGTGVTFTGKTSDSYQLCMLESTGWLSQTTAYSIWCGNETPSKLFYDFDRDISAIVEQNGDVFHISYGDKFDNVQYVGYSSSLFQGTTAASNLFFYTIEAMTVVDYGVVTFDPVDGINSSNSFAADQYVLWPNAVMDQDGTYVNGTHYSSNNTNYHDATDIVTDGDGDGDDDATLADVYRTYKLMSLQDLYDQDVGWQDGRGNVLRNTNLRKKFAMKEGIDFSLSLNIPWFGIGNVQTNDKSVVAPVGPGGASSNIPTGSVAFRINETTEKGSNIYVIVSVPVSKFYDTASEDESLITDVDYYLGLWQTQDIDDDAFSYNTFSQTTAVQKFELPRSRPYDPDGATPANSDYILVEYGGTTYRCYLNGDRVLVAYQFTVTEAGTYILGTAIGDSDLFEASTYKYPMEIVYCAADGTASEGLDGTIGSVTGALDYVYAYDGNIVNVQDYTGTVPTGDYTYYYSSRIVTYTDNGALEDTDKHLINDMMIYPYRYVADNKIYLNMKVLSGDSQFYFTYKRTGTEPDEVVSTTGSRPSS